MELQSEKITEISAALAKAQLAMKVPTKDKTNPHFKNNYASLGSILSSCKDALNENGISLTQPIFETENKTYVVTTLSHISGQWMKSYFSLRVANNATSQQVGSSLTYTKKYALCALLAIDGDEYDDDGNEATQSTKNSTAQANGNGNQNVAQQKKEDPTISEDEYKSMMQVVSSYPLLIKELQAICKTQDLRHIPKTQLKACGLYAKKYIENIEKIENEEVVDGG